jgi:multidrug efflux pump subunit AcrB
VSQTVISRFEQTRGIHFPDGIQATIARNYGVTAEEKAQTLIHKQAFATASVVLLVLLTLGFWQALGVGAAVVVTLAIMLFASWVCGFADNWFVCIHDSDFIGDPCGFFTIIDGGRPSYNRA